MCTPFPGNVYVLLCVMKTKSTKNRSNEFVFQLILGHELEVEVAREQTPTHSLKEISPQHNFISDATMNHMFAHLNLNFWTISYSNCQNLLWQWVHVWLWHKTLENTFACGYILTLWKVQDV
jgi:hypothetical protein